MPGAGTIASELSNGAALLTRAGIPDAGRAASSLWACLTHGSRGRVWLDRHTHATRDACDQFRRAIERRILGEPMQYVIGSAGFRGLELMVDRRVLIPRPETEGLVGLVLEWTARRNLGTAWGTAVDVGTGSGCIALSLADEGNFARVIATDISAGALAVAAHNVAAIAPGGVSLQRGSLLEHLAANSADVIVSNPPYVTVAEHAGLDSGVRDYEPSQALVSGVGGLDHTRQILDDGRRVLRPGGLLAIELDSTRAETSCLIAEAVGWHARVHQDLFGRPRYLIVTRSAP